MAKLIDTRPCVTCGGYATGYCDRCLYSLCGDCFYFKGHAEDKCEPFPVEAVGRIRDGTTAPKAE